MQPPHSAEAFVGSESQRQTRQQSTVATILELFSMQNTLKLILLAGEDSHNVGAVTHHDQHGEHDA